MLAKIFGGFAPQTPIAGAYSALPYPLAVGTSHLIFADHFWKDNSNPVVVLVLSSLSENMRDVNLRLGVTLSSFQFLEMMQ